MNQYTIAFIMIVVLVVAAVVTFTATPQQANERNPELDRLTTQINSLKHEMQNTDGADDETKQRLQDLEAKYKAEQSKAQASTGPFIKAVPIDGQDLLSVLGIDNVMWKYEFELPADVYTNYVWIEIWHRGDKRPEIRLLSTQSSSWSKSTLLIKRPTPDFPREFVQIGNGTPTYNTDPKPIQIDNPYRLDKLDAPEPLKAGDDVYLLTIKRDPIKTLSANRRDVHKDYETVIYFKTKFVKGDYVKWVDPYEGVDTTPPTPEPAPPTPTPTPTPGTSPSNATPTPEPNN
ncbi:MAG: hypothetical protein GC159_00285 [Phycisphaera sp.]|nr:hypothetical protein [Phycisphaera sp.]